MQIFDKDDSVQLNPQSTYVERDSSQIPLGEQGYVRRADPIYCDDWTQGELSVYISWGEKNNVYGVHDLLPYN